MLRQFTCIMCPKGCEITGEVEDGKVLTIEGNDCKRGAEYVTQELISPMRNIASSVLVTGGEADLASVRLDAPIPKDRIFDVMKEIRRIKVEAPVKIGQVVLENVLGLGSNVIITKNVDR